LSRISGNVYGLSTPIEKVLLPESGKAVQICYRPKKVSPENILYPRIGPIPLIAGVSSVERLVQSP
jgi:hypothetical protein